MIIPNTLNVDWGLLRQQKARLADVAASLGNEQLLTGLLGILDGIQDYAAAQIGVGEVFGESNEHDQE